VSSNFPVALQGGGISGEYIECGRKP